MKRLRAALAATAVLVTAIGMPVVLTSPAQASYQQCITYMSNNARSHWDGDLVVKACWAADAGDSDRCLRTMSAGNVWPWADAKMGCKLGLQ